jgi:hypothetical protein
MGMTTSPAEKAAFKDNASALIHHANAPKNKGATPTAKLFNTIRRPHTPRA